MISWSSRGLIVPDACKKMVDFAAAGNIIHLFHINLCQSNLLTYFVRNIYGLSDNIQLKLIASQLDPVWIICFLIGAWELWKRRLKLFPVVILKHSPGFVWRMCFHQMKTLLLSLGAQYARASCYVCDLPNCLQCELSKNQQGGCDWKTHISQVCSLIRLVKGNRIQNGWKSCV